MSRETRRWLNEFILVGNCKERPNSWANDPGLRDDLGLADNHFQDPIPYQVVVDRLFNWQAVSVPKANLVPCAKKDANWFDTDGNPFKIVMSSKYDYKKKLVVSGEQGVVRSDTLGHIATHSGKYRIHDYKEWLLDLHSNVIGDSLTIIGAGLLRGGAQAYVQVALPVPETESVSGMTFIPYILASTSLDGSLPSTFSAGSILVVCDNTRDWALREAKMKMYKAKHTSKSLDQDKIQDVREALGIIHQTADSMSAEFAELSSIPITRRQTLKVLDIIQPIPKSKEGGTARQIIIAENKREKLLHSIFRDPAGGREWSNTALGVSNGISTYFTWETTVKGNRLERNMEKTIKGSSVEKRGEFQLGPIKSGATFSDADKMTLGAMAHVLERPDLMPSN